MTYETFTDTIDVLAFFKTQIENTSTTTRPDAELLFVSGGLHSDKGIGIRKVFSISREVYDAVWKPVENESVFQVS